METPKIYFHGSYIGTTGYNQHTRDFLRHLSKHCELKVRNFTVGKTWKGYSETPHDEEPYINNVDKKILYQQILWNNDGSRTDYPIYPTKNKDFFHDLNIVLCETDHHIFYDNYIGPKIAYNVWESTLQPEHFFNKLLEYDELWVPSKWQKEVTVKQGYPEEKIRVVPEGVDIHTFFPEKVTHPLTSDRFTFFLAGRWDYRKSIKEIIETFLKTFNNDEPVDLIVSVDNPFSNDGLNTTEERLEFYGLNDERIKVLHFPPRNEYIDILKSTSVFVSCARSEGWNLPLIESMACGTVSIYSNCSGQLEFAENKGIPVNIIGEKPSKEGTYNHFNNNVGNYYEPDFEHLSEQMRYSYENWYTLKQQALKDSDEIRKNFSWEKISEVGSSTVQDFMNRKPWGDKYKSKNEIKISFLDGPRVEIIGDENQIYYVEFLNSDNHVLFSDTIKNNMWTACSTKYFVEWKIRINGEIVETYSLENKRVLISLESSSLGDTVAWAPYAVEFSKKHNCKVILSTFHNNFFKNNPTYKDIEFISPGSITECYSVYRLGWFRKDNKWNDTSKNPIQVNTIPLQQTATDILGLEFTEINHGIFREKQDTPHSNKYIVFAPNATAGCKEWKYEYWVMLFKMVQRLGYDVITLTKTPFYIDGTKNVWGEPLSIVINYLDHAEAFVGLGSGLSWLNWGLGKHTYMINGFARPDHEFTTNVTRIFNEGVCISCWNDSEFVFDAGDWDWCPVYKGTVKQHICQKSITPLQVFNSLKL
jgi:autotransporter strand-loop-strand O-heptosyltransferase